MIQVLTNAKKHHRCTATDDRHWLISLRIRIRQQFYCQEVCWLHVQRPTNQAADSSRSPSEKQHFLTEQHVPHQNCNLLAGVLL